MKTTRVLVPTDFSAASLEAMKFYTQAQDLARDGQREEAIEYYAMAIEEDSGFARAYSGWALEANKLGRSSESEEKWQQALGLLDRLTERERYRTLGLYYSFVSLNFSTAIENYQKLVERFPADGAGRNNLAVLYTMTAQYDRALGQSEQLLRIYPNRILYHANHAHYAMYAGDMETVRREAQYVLDEDPDYYKAYMFMAIAELHAGNIEAAKANYQRMADTGVQGRSLANIGLADIALFQGNQTAAVSILQESIETDRKNDDERGTGTKRIALANAHEALGDVALALATIDQLDAARGDGQLVPSASVYAANGRYDDAFTIAENYRKQLSPTARAYANLIDGINAFHQGEYILAIESLRSAIESADLWIIRYYLARTYLEAGYPAEASAEFDACIERRGEAGNLFFDDVPTWRYTASLQEWKEKASSAISNLSTSSQ
jgi:tetratricopeptide (TPR) repeat protein